MTTDDLIVLPHQQHSFETVLIEGQFVSLEMTFFPNASQGRCVGGYIIMGDVRMAIGPGQTRNLEDRTRAAIDAALIGSGFVPGQTLQ